MSQYFLTPEQAKNEDSASGHGLMLSGLSPYFPGISCVKCGKFVGRDGHMDVEYWENSFEVASVDGTCLKCLSEEGR